MGPLLGQPLGEGRSLKNVAVGLRVLGGVPHNLPNLWAPDHEITCPHARQHTHTHAHQTAWARKPGVQLSEIAEVEIV